MGKKNRGQPSPYKPTANEDCEACNTCGLWERCESPFMRGRGPDIKDGVDYIVVGEAPGAQEDFNNCPFHEDGDSGDLIRETIKKFNGDLKGFLFTNAVRCRPPQNKITSVVPINMCRGFLESEIDKIRPKAILMLGNRALQSMFHRQGITKVRRSVLEYEVVMGESIPCIAAFHPSFALRDANNRPAFEGDIEYFCKFIRGEAGESDYADYVKGANLNPTVKDIKAMHRRARGGCTSIDFETNSLRPELMGDFRITALSIYNDTDFMVIRLDTPYKRLRKDDPKVEAVIDFLTDPEIEKEAHHAKYELHCARRRWKIKIANLGCTKNLHALLHPYHTSRTLDALGQQYIGVGKDPDMDAFFRDHGGMSNETWLHAAADEHWPTLSRYAAGDSKLEFEVSDELHDQLESADTVWMADGEIGLSPTDHYYDVILPSMYLLQDIEERGLLLDRPYMEKLRVKKVQQMEQIERDVNRMKIVRRHVRDRITKDFKNGKWKKQETYERHLKAATFNIGSPDQVREVLFDPDYFHLDYDKRKVTPQGEPQVDKDVIAELINSWEGHAIGKFCGFRQEYAALEKDVGTYIDGLFPWMDKNDYVHTQFNQDVATTGRLSSKDPNLQNQKKKGADELRRMFIAPRGYDLVEMDFSQIELRILAAYSRDEDMVGIYIRGEDLHAETMAAITKMGVFDAAQYAKWDDKDKRGLAKNVNFGIVYGISAYGLSQQLDGEDMDICQDMIDAVYRRFPGIVRWQEEVMAFAAKKGRVYTMFGNWRDIPNARIVAREGNRDDEMLVAEALRQAINMPVQGTATKCTEVAAVRINHIFKKKRIPARIVNIIHDAIFFYAKHSARDEAIAIAKKVMESEPQKWIGDYLEGIPIIADAKYGPNWAELKDAA